MSINFFICDEITEKNSLKTIFSLEKKLVESFSSSRLISVMRLQQSSLFDRG